MLTCVSAIALMLAGCLGGADDPADGSSGIDVRRVLHNNNERTITYHLQAYAAFAGDDDQETSWFLDFDGNFNTPGGASVEFTTDDAATVVACSSGGIGGYAFIAREASGAAGSTDMNTIAVRFQIAALRTCGLTGEAYRYVVSTNIISEPGVVDDVVPNSFLGGPGIAHFLVVS
jgi:hypothetical protein